MVIMYNCVTQILIVLSLILKQNIFFEDIAHDDEKGFDMSNYEVDRPLPIGKK